MSSPVKKPLDALGDQNPFTPSIIRTALQRDNGVHEYLDRQAEILRQQHNSREAGETTFTWDQLTQTTVEQLFQLGAEGRFFDPSQGVVRAVYAQFVDMIPSLWEGGPVGSRKDADSPWVVTNDLALSSRDRCQGIMGTYIMPANNSFGWVIVEGLNLQSIAVPGVFDLTVAMGWGIDDQIAPSEARNIGTVWKADFAIIDGQQTIAPGAFKVAVRSTSPTLPAPPTPFDPSGLQDQLNEIRHDFESSDEELGFRMARTEERLVVQNPNIYDLAYTQQQEVIANFLSQAQTAANNALNASSEAFIRLQASIQNQQITKVYRDEAGFYAESSVSQTIMATAQANEALAQAIAASGSAASASLSAAEASSYVALVAQIGPASMVRNSTFALWPDSSTLPIAWTTAYPNYTFTQAIDGLNGPYAFEMVGPTSGTDAGILARETENIGLKSGTGAFILEADIELISGSLVGAGLELYGYDNTPTFQEGATLNFATDVDISGAVIGAGTVDRIYRYRKFVKLTDVDTRFFRLAALNGRSSISGASANKTIRWHRASVRPASQAEVNGSQALVDAASASAAVVTEATARATADSAIASNVTTLTTTVNGHTSTLTTYGTSINGLQSQYGVEITAGSPPRITGFKILGSATRSDFIIDATRFQINDGTATPPFTVVGGVTYIKQAQIQSGDIITSKIAADAISRMVAAFTSGTITIPSGSGTWTTAQFINITTRGGPVKIDLNFFSLWAHVSNVNGAQYRLIRQNASTLTATQILGPVSLNSVPTGTYAAAYQGSNGFTIVDNPAAGSWNYYYQIDQTGCAYCSAYYRAIAATELLK